MSPARSRAYAAGHALTLLAGGLALAYMGRTLWFHYDEWDIVGNHSLGLFQPHNEHWSTLPYLAYGALYPLFGLRQYAPYLAIVLLLHLGVTHLLWRLLRAEGVSNWLATTVAAAFLVLGPGAENLYWAWQMGFVGSVCFGLVAVLLATTGTASRRRDMLAAVALLAGLMCSGVGVTMLLVAGMAIWLRRGRGPAVAIVIVPTVVFAAWYATAGHAVTRSYARPTLVGSLQFLGEGLAATAELGYDLPLVGPALAIAGAAWTAWQLRRQGHRDRQAHAVAIAGILGAVALFALISLGRAQYGPEAATQGRYVYVAAALLLPVAGLALQGLAGRRRLGQLAAGLLVGLALLHNTQVLVARERDHRAVSATTRRLVLAAAARVGAPGARFDPDERPDPTEAPTLTLARVAGFQRDRAMPSN